MSLKAKLEAVIYAAEEPVTLAQLSALFAAEALEWKAAQESAAAAAVAEQARQENEPLPLLNAAFDYLELDQEADAPAVAGADAAPEAGTASVGEAGAVESTSVEAGAEIAAEPGDGDEAAEAKRLARLRDREVREILRGLLDELIASYASDDRGVEIKEVAGGYRMATKPECHDAARMFVKSLKPVMKLSLPALETLAVIAYKQPVTAPEVNEIRGVDSSAVFGSLLARKLISTAGRKQVIGRPILYKTTREFLLRFGLKDVTELPSMEEFEKLAELEFEEGELEGETEEAREIEEDLSLESEGGGEEPIEESAGDSAAATRQRAEQEGNETAAMVDRKEAPAALRPDTTEPRADTPACEAERHTAEAAPAAPSSLEQAETETVPHD
jgi:segregation and condensation protein B